MKNGRLAIVKHRFLSVSVLSLAIASSASASFYPPGYVIENNCQMQGPVEVCAVNHHFGSFPRLTIKYTGTLLATSWGRISAYVKLNGRDGVFAMQNADYAEWLRLNEPRPYLCYTFDSTLPRPATEPPAYGGYGWCKYTGHPGGGGLAWEVGPLPERESQLFFYARNEMGLANAWDVEVAFVSTSNGTWDSLGGANYRFRFDAR